MTKTEAEQSNGVALKLVNKANGDFLLANYKDTSDVAVAVFSERTRETIFFTYDESGELSNEVFTISFLESNESVVETNLGTSLVEDQPVEESMTYNAPVTYNPAPVTETVVETPVEVVTEPVAAEAVS